MWHDRDFRRLWLGQTLSQLGEHTSLVVLPLTAVLTLGAGAAELGALRAAGQAPLLLLPLLVGAWVDRRRTVPLLVRSDLARAIALGAAAAAGLVGALGLPGLYTVAIAVGALSVLFDVAYQTSLVRLVPAGQLAYGNSALEASRSSAQTGGPALGGALVSLVSAPIAAAACAAAFAGSALAAGRISRPEAAPVAPDAVRPPMVRQVGEGLRFAARQPALRALGLASAAFQFTFSAAMTVQLLYLPRVLHLSGTEIGLALAATGPGALLGSLLAARLPGRVGYGPLLVTAAAVGDGVLLCVPALPGPSALTFPALLAVQFGFGAGGQLVNVMTMAVRQALAPAGMQGRAAATLTFAGMGTTPLGSLLGGALAQTWGLRPAFVVAAAGMLLSPLVMALSPLARLGRTLPG
ncbi:MFS transporter [Streptomyces sp. VRA16 Mangrove soil]|nr:MFS transporter [Streptomyces sp. VRA16 Mangrove soil]